MLQYTINNDTLTVFDEDFVPFSIDSSHPNHQLVLRLVESGQEDQLDTILELMKPIESVKKAVSGTGITIEGDTLYRNGVELHGLLIDRILFHHSMGNTIDHLVRFLDKLYLNPSHRVVNQLYGFLEASNVAITPDGNFVAYKIVRHDYKDLYTGTYDYSPGKVVKEDRNQVDEDPDRTCSKGIHACGFGYLHFYGAVRSGTDRVVSVSISPTNVVAVPRDYNNNKMRVCELLSLADITDKVKSTWNAYGGIGTTVGLDHALSYTNSDWQYDEPDGFDYRGYLDVDDDDWYTDQDDNDYDRYLASDLYLDGEWVEHELTPSGRGNKGLLPSWVCADDELMIDWGDGPRGPYLAEYVHGWDTSVKRYRLI